MPVRKKILAALEPLHLNQAAFIDPKHNRLFTRSTFPLRDEQLRKIRDKLAVPAGHRGNQGS